MRVRTHPGEVLRHEYLEPLRLSATALAEKLDVLANRITDIVRGHRDVTADTALRLAEFFDTTPEFWMNLQSAHDLSKASARRAARKIKTADVTALLSELRELKRSRFGFYASAKSTAASQLTQTKRPRETTSKGVASAGSKKSA